VITGFNTDIEHEGVVYHVQTEDKGLDTPVILSLVYVGGAILASKRSPYDDLVVAGFDAAALGERLNHQHKLICAAITAGRIEELKRLNRKGEGANGEGPSAARESSRKAPVPQPPAAAVKPGEAAAAPGAAAGGPTVSARTAALVPPVGDAVTRPPAEAVKSGLPPRPETKAKSAATPLKQGAATVTPEPGAPRRLPPREAHVGSGAALPLAEVLEEVATRADAGTAATGSGAAPPKGATEAIPVEVDGELHVSLMEERDYKSGEIVTLRVRVARGPLDAREAVSGAAVTIKILGTEFRPLILTSKTDGDGVAVIHAWLPRFTGGRAAILVRAAHDGFTAELRRPVRHL
jgi:hypothetical protein